MIKLTSINKKLAMAKKPLIKMFTRKEMMTRSNVISIDGATSLEPSSFHYLFNSMIGDEVFQFINDGRITEPILLQHFDHSISLRPERGYCMYHQALKQTCPRKESSSKCHELCSRFRTSGSPNTCTAVHHDGAKLLRRCHLIYQSFQNLTDRPSRIVNMQHRHGWLHGPLLIPHLQKPQHKGRVGVTGLTSCNPFGDYTHIPKFSLVLGLLKTSSSVNSSRKKRIRIRKFT